MKAVYVDPGKTYDSTFGHYRMSKWVGQAFGSKVLGEGGKGWAYVLRPTPELWTLTLPHRTQILYAADISLVCSFLDLAPGSVVLESGTGSGSLTHSLARAVAPHGRVHSFEFHEQRAAKAREELARHGLAGCATVEHRDVEAGGFPEALHGRADGVFLDLPHPWTVVRSAAACLVPDGVVCSFSPCIEQVQRTCLALEELGFGEVRTFECLQRVIDVVNERRGRDVDAIAGAGESPWGVARGDREGAGGGDAGEGGGGSAGAGKGGRGQGDARLPDACFERRVVCRPQVAARGHTGYLTFARKSVVPVRVAEGTGGGDGGGSGGETT